MSFILTVIGTCLTLSGSTVPWSLLSSTPSMTSTTSSLTLPPVAMTLTPPGPRLHVKPSTSCPTGPHPAVPSASAALPALRWVGRWVPALYLRAQFFRRNINMYLHFMSLLHPDMP